MCSRFGTVVCISFATVTLSFSLALLCSVAFFMTISECVVVRLDDNSGEFMHDMTEWEKCISKWVVFQKCRSISSAFYSFQQSRDTPENVELLNLYVCDIKWRMHWQHNWKWRVFVSQFSHHFRTSSPSLSLSSFIIIIECVRALFSVTEKKFCWRQPTE